MGTLSNSRNKEEEKNVQTEPTVEGNVDDFELLSCNKSLYLTHFEADMQQLAPPFPQIMSISLQSDRVHLTRVHLILSL